MNIFLLILQAQHRQVVELLHVGIDLFYHCRNILCQISDLIVQADRSESFGNSLTVLGLLVIAYIELYGLQRVQNKNKDQRNCPHRQDGSIQHDMPA